MRSTLVAGLFALAFSPPASATWWGSWGSCPTVADPGTPGASLVAVSSPATASATYCGSSAGHMSTVKLVQPDFHYIATGHLTPSGKLVDLGSFTVGDELVFAMYVWNTHDVFYSGPASRNDDGVAHVAIADLGSGVYQLGFEDAWGGGDLDYDDIVLVVDTSGFAIVGADGDGDGVPDDDDVCPSVHDPGQLDTDADGAGDACDACPFDAANDADGDGVCGDVDNCPDSANADQADADGDGPGDACDICPFDADDDIDGDGVCGDVDNCIDVANADQADADGDLAGDVCDVCPLDPDDDADGDGVCGNLDICADTELPDAAAFVRLGVNRWADVDGDGEFETTAPPGGPGPQTSYTLDDTAGCTCAQIVDILNLGKGHLRFGCTDAAMQGWISTLP